MARSALLVSSRQSSTLLIQQFLATYLGSWLRTATKGRVTASPVVITAPAGTFAPTLGDTPEARLVHFDESPAALRPLAAAGADARRSTVVDALPEVLPEAEQAALLVLLDVTSGSLPLDDLTALLTGPRAGRWPSSDVIAFIRADAIRRTAAKLIGERRSEAALEKLDRAVGAEWRTEYHSGGAGAVVRGYLRRLEAALPGRAWPAAVRVNPNDEPVFWLILITRQPHGAWAFADAVARARRGWRRTLRQAGAEKSPTEQLAVEGLQSAERLAVGAERHEERAVVENLKRNLLETRRRVGEFRISDRPREVLDGLFGTADTAQIRAAVRELHAAGKTLSTGVGGDIRDHVLRLPDRRAR
ncbi:hypothetical protein [Cryptosporangium aurantiacum]|uniref:Three-Cys-motif partner protein n=1 Tax=Cryptosporangium aurantiacum TaxID=134849 RepID=A0A1M7NNB9_9ACTN|nr:hypothetical protein [Cryptosporangium aurantiacum]SHN05294.1 hypothetical protein SAMN05443668_102735 [Cryptosporangium aurantiacum]